MSQFIAKIIDRYLLFKLHMQKSAISQFISTQRFPAPEEYKSFYFQPQIPEVHFTGNILGKYRMGNFSFRSEISNGQANEFAIGDFYQNSEKTKMNIILVHGWRQGKDRIKDIYLQPLMSEGYNLYFYTLPHHSERQDVLSSYNGEFMISANIERTLSSVRQAVVDLRALIRWLKTGNSEKVIVIGISLGGLLTNLTATVEENIDGLITVFSPNELSYAIWNTIPGKNIKRDFKKNGYTYDLLKTSWDVINTSNFDSMLPKEKILMLSALYDKYIDFSDASTLWEKWGRPERRIYPCGHAGIALYKSRIANDSLEFLQKIEGS